MANEQKRPPPFVQYEQRQQYVRLGFPIPRTSILMFKVCTTLGLRSLLTSKNIINTSQLLVRLFKRIFWMEVSYTLYMYFDVEGMYHIRIEVTFNLQKNHQFFIVVGRKVVRLFQRNFLDSDINWSWKISRLGFRTWDIYIFLI